MSKTDKTRPYWVWVGTELRSEFHDHRDGVCNLPDDPLDSEHDWRKCHYTHRVDGVNHFCGCWMCTGQEWRRQDRRKSRHEARAAIRRGDWDSLPGRTKPSW
jgi:hypothetical protein